ncbi:MAG: hypothetical protein Q9186_006557 [Xanthomendoza sp. 1 TL-2023]
MPTTFTQHLNGDHGNNREYGSMSATLSTPNAAVMPIAVVGLAGRFPGNATTPQNLWEMCCHGESAWSEIPTDRMNATAYFHPNPSKSGCFNSRGAHFLNEDIGLFDASFFNVSPNEAKAMDPQQRLLLEVTYEALENGGVTLEGIAGTSTGVYVGAAQIDYSSLLFEDVEDLPLYQSTGTSANILSNRISYVFDLKGPSITMDTACSSSLAALHTACQSLRTGEVTQAIVCGAHIMLSPDTMVGMSMLKLFGEEGRSYTFDSRATGYGRGEGIVSLLIKPLDAAVRDSDNIRAIIRNTGVNQDGKTNGITYPSCEAQIKLMHSVYSAAGLDPTATDYVEAHGTGTAAGDPVEAEAISRVFTDGRSIDAPLIVGSLKTNVGHLEAASGLTGMVKVIYALETGLIPPNINFDVPNPAVPLADWKLKVRLSTCSSSLGLSDLGAPLAGTLANIQNAPSFHQQLWVWRQVCMIFVDCTNAHVILEQYTGDQTSNGYPHTEELNGHSMNVTLEAQSRDTSMDSDSVMTPESLGEPHKSRRRLLVFSAGDKTSLQHYIDRIASYLSGNKLSDDEALMDRLAFTLGSRRSALSWREAVAASTPAELSELLSGTPANSARSFDKPALGFVFTGQGAQWPAMGRELFIYPVFAKSMQESDAYLRDCGADWSLLDELRKDAELTLVNRPYVSQPATTAIQIALVSLLFSWGIRPTAVVGHSSGEIAAAYAAGALSARSCLLIAFQRGVLAETLSKDQTERPGRMLAIGASPAKVRPMIQRLGSAQVVIACVNAPSLVTASGDERGISRLQTITEQESLFNRRLKVDVAYHSPHMQDISPQYLSSLESVEPQQVHNVEFHSSVRGHQIDTRSLDAAYWVENMTSPVRFLDAVQGMFSEHQRPDALIEIGPHSTLESPIRDIMKSNSQWSSRVRYFSSLIRGQHADSTMLSLASALFVLGCRLDLDAINHADCQSPALLGDLPAYPWNHSKRHWHESRLSINHRHRRFPRSDILGSLVDDYNDVEPRWRNILRLSDIPWLADHQVQGSIIFPLTGYLAMAIEGAFQNAILHELPVTPISQYKLRHVKLDRSMVLREDFATEVSLVMRPQKEGSRSGSSAWNEFRVFSWTHEGGWVEHCYGLISITRGDREPNPINGVRQAEDEKQYYKDAIATIKDSSTKTLATSDIYSRFSRGGLEFGPAFRNISAAHAAKGHSTGTITIPDTAMKMPNQHENIHIIHPGTFDAFFQVTDFAAGAGDLTRSDIHVPTFVKEITVCHALPRLPGYQLDCYAQASPITNASQLDNHASFFVVDRESTADPLIRVQGLVVTKLPEQNLSVADSGERGLCYKLSWEPYLDLLKAEDFRTVFDGPIHHMGSVPQVENLERAAFAYIKSTVAKITAHEATSFPPHYQQLHRVMSSLLESSHRSTLPLQTRPWLDSGEAENDEFLQSLESSDECGRLVCKMGRSLPSILRQETEPLSTMLQDNMLKNYYRHNDIVNWCYGRTASIIGKLAHQKPSMRIIELGAGTGGATMPMLRRLGRRFAHLDFTDVSTGFFESAKAEQTAWAEKISYQKLDIEQDPVSQGFQPESYDLVVATNVLHATKNIARTTRNIRRLVKPGGKALIVEITGQTLSSLLIFGTLPGWWLGEEPERRDGPFISEKQWHTVLCENGFSGVDGNVQINDYSHSIVSVMLTTALTEKKPVIPAVGVVQPRLGNDEPLINILSGLLSSRSGQALSAGQLLEADLTDRYTIVVAMDDSIWLDMNETALRRMQDIFQSARGILWVVRGASSQHPTANMIAGVARSIRSENAGLRLSTIDFDGKDRLPDAKVAELILQLADHIFDQRTSKIGADMDFLETKGVLHIPRALGDKQKDDYVIRETRRPVPGPEQLVQDGRHLEMKLGQVGLLDSIYFEGNETLQLPLADDEVEIVINATGMNFKDVMISLGQIPYQDLGLECSGVVSGVGCGVLDIRVGDRVFGMAKGAYASSVRVKDSMVAGMPPDMTFSQAASIPVVFCTAQYALIDMGRLCKGDKVLIHAAAGGVGQAAIMLAQSIGAEIYATVGSVEKLNLLLKMYGIAEDHIFSSRDTSFAKAIMEKTSQQGVDVVLNSTAGEILHQSWQCLAPFGRFIEIGKRDIVQNSYLEMDKFADSVSFISVDLSILREKKPLVIKEMLKDVIEMHQRKIIRPVTPIKTIAMSELGQGMRMMQGGKHMGKIVVEVTPSDVVQVMPAASPNAPVSADASYLITGGTGGLGRSITRWLAAQGAKNIVLASRSGTKQRGVTELIDEVKSLGANVVVKACDIADSSQVQRLVDECHESMPPIRGVIHGAMALRDALFDKISHKDWTLNITPRVNGAWNLHHSLSTSPLDFFVILASGSGILGTPGQTAYAASNSFLDSFAAYRQSLGLAACTIDIGIVEGVGYVAENIDRRAEISLATHDSLSERELHALVKAAILNSHNPSYRQTMTGFKLSPDRPLPVWGTVSMFSHILHDMQALSASAANSTDGVVPMRQLLKAASSMAEATGLMVGLLVEKLTNLLMITQEDIDIKKPIVAYGLDSLVAVEFRNWITRDLEAHVPLMVLMNSPSIENLGGKIAAESNLVDKGLA